MIVRIHTKFTPYIPHSVEYFTKIFKELLKKRLAAPILRLPSR
jgi:hypothetical protein